MDISKAIVAHLGSVLGVRVSTERPANPPSRMVTVVRLGGGGGPFDERPGIAIDAWGASESDAYRLAMQASEAMFSLPESADNVVSVEQDSLYSNTYPDGTRRWTGNYSIYCNR